MKAKATLTISPILITFTLFILLVLGGLCACGDDSGDGSGDYDGMRKANAGLSIQVDESSGKMQIERPKIEDPQPMGEKDTWTIFVYLSGVSSVSSGRTSISAVSASSTTSFSWYT